jgi:hypothetical protein
MPTIDATPLIIPKPEADVCFVFTGIHNLCAIENSAPEATEEAVAIHNDVLRAVFQRHNGCEIACRDGSFMFTFESPEIALRSCVQA